MTKRKFVLPGIQDLSKEQEKARALPKEGQHVIIGGPGTGKSVLTLLRAKRHQRDGDDYIFLVFNHLLNKASGQLFGGDLVSKTWDSWFREIFRKAAGSSIPRLEPRNGFRGIDWESAKGIIGELPDRGSQASPFLVIDEGQDMPPEFYTALVDLGFDRFFVVADQNQQIREENSSRKEIMDCLAIETTKVIELRKNYRNKYAVARLAREFYTRDPASPPPELPDPSQGYVRSVPRLIGYDASDLGAITRRILRLADRDPRRLIGVIAPNNVVRERYLEALKAVDVRLDNPPPSITTYHQGNRAEVAFDEGGIMVINAQACKGLEFDVVMLADIDEHYVSRQDPDRAKRLFYVMVARAREQVFMFRKRDGRKDIDKILPNDHNILRREEI